MKNKNVRLSSFGRSFDELPDVIIEDPIHLRTFFIPHKKLVHFEASPALLKQVDTGTVTFVIPDQDSLNEIQPFVETSDGVSSFLIQFRKTKTAYFITYDQLLDFSAESSIAQNDNVIRFIIPFGLESVEDLPTIRNIGASQGAGW